MTTSYDDALLRLERIPDFIGINDAPSVGEDDPEVWHVQVINYLIMLSNYFLGCSKMKLLNVYLGM